MRMCLPVLQALCCLAALAGCDPHDKPPPAAAAAQTQRAAPVATSEPATTGPQSQPATAPSPARFYAAVGYSRAADPLAAAEEAATKALDQCKAAGVVPVAAIFLERLTGVAGKDGARIGEKVKQVAGAATFGHGGAGTSGPTWAAERNGEAGLMVLLLGGRGLSVRGFATGGRIEHDDSQDPARAAQVRKLREACAQRGEALARQVPALDGGGLVLVLGALHHDWHVTFLTAFQQRLAGKAPIVGGVGRWDDYVYLDGRPITDPAGKPTHIGQLAVVVRGDISVAVEPVVARNKYKARIVLDEGLAAAQDVGNRLAPARAGLLLAFSCTTRLTDARLPGPAEELANFRQAFGPDVPVFGGFCGGEVGTDAEGNLSVGADRLVLCGVAEREGSTANQPVGKDQWLLRSPITDVGVERPSNDVGPGNVAVTVPLDPSMSFGDMLRPNDRVNICGCIPINQSLRTFRIIEGVRVLAMAGAGTEGTKMLDPSPRTDRSARSHRSITIELAEEESIKFANVRTYVSGNCWIELLSTRVKTTKEFGRVNSQLKDLAARPNCPPRIEDHE